MIQYLILNTRIRLGIFFTNFPNVGMLVIAAVGQTKFPVLIGLGLYAVQKLSEELLRRIIKRRQDAELDHMRKNGLLLALRLLCGREACRAVPRHILTLLQLAANLPHNPRNGTVARQAISGLLIEMKSLSKGNGQLPGEAALDAIELEGQLLDFLFRLLDLADQDLGLLPLCLIKFFIIHLFLIIHILLHNFPVVYSFAFGSS